MKDNFFATVYVRNVIREMLQKTYVIRDLNENRLLIHDRDPLPPPPPLYHPDNYAGWTVYLSSSRN